MRVGWLFSLIRSGSSVTAYSAAHPWNHAVADEPFGPWDRTGAPYHYPAEQARLVGLFDAAAHRLDGAVTRSAERLFEALGRSTGGLVVKIPHDRPVPDEVGRVFPTHRFAFLLRNPLHRLNSLHVRGMLAPNRPRPIGPNHDLEQFKAFARRWRSEPHRLLYDDLHRRPREFFATLYRAWAWDHTEEDLARACEYAARHYHAASARLAPRSNPRNVVSVARRALPDEAIEVYLGDDLVREVMLEAGWSLRPEDYRAPRP